MVVNFKKYNSIDELNPSKSEWAGYYKDKKGRSKKLKAKSFETFEDSFDEIFCALFYILSDGTYFYDENEFSKNIALIEGDVITDKFESFFKIHLVVALLDLYKKVTGINFFCYEKHERKSVKISGNINFSKTLQSSGGLIHEHICNKTKIVTNHPVFFLVKTIFHFFYFDFQSDNIFPKEFVSKLQIICSHVESMFTSSSFSDPVKIACDVLHGKYDKAEPFRIIMPELKILASVYLDNKIFFSENNQQYKSNDIPISGMVFNLNRPFEIIIRKSLEYFFKDKCAHIDSLPVLTQKGKIYFKMKPDIFLRINERTLILDVKHKVKSRELLSGDDRDFSHEKIDRNDLYQIISYATAFREYQKKNDPNDIFGLIALHSENKLSTREDYIVTHEIIEVENRNEFKINLLTVRLGSFLHDLGYAIKDSNNSSTYIEGERDFRGMFVELGEQINLKLQIISPLLNEINDLKENVHEEKERNLINSFDGLLYLYKLKINRTDLSINVPIENQSEFIRIFKGELVDGTFDVGFNSIETLRSYVFLKDINAILQFDRKRENVA